MSAHLMFAEALAQARRRQGVEAWERDWWCAECGQHRAKLKGGLCPGCEEDKQKEGAGQ